MTPDFNPWRTIPIFISSTFLDMDAERDYIKKIILPKLNEVFSKQRITLHLIDLRSSVKTNNLNTQEEREVLVLKVCLDEIKRSRPFFISLIGARYGWIPKEERYQNIIKQLLENEKQLLVGSEHKSVTAIEIAYGALGAPEQLPRSLFYFRGEDSYNEMSAEKLAEFCDSHSKLMTAIEKQNSINKLNLLKHEIEDACRKSDDLSDNITNYTLTWDGEKFNDISLKKFGDKLETDLIREISAEIGSQVLQPQSWYEQENIYLDEFIHHKTINFVGREAMLTSMCKMALNENYTRFYTGFSGTGKSSLMCMLYNRIANKLPQNNIVLFHSAEASPISKNIFQMLQRWSQELCVQLGMIYVEEQVISTEKDRDEKTFEERVIEQFQNLTSEAKQHDKRLILLIDAFDQFSKNDISEYITFFNDDICIIITSLPENAKKAIKLNSASQMTFIEPFNKNDALSLLHDKFHSSVIQHIVDRKDDEYKAYSSPLWVTLTINALSSLDIYDFTHIRKRNEIDNEAKIECYLCEMTDNFPIYAGELFSYLMHRASKDFGVELTFKTFQYIAIGRNGLREQDLKALLGDEWDELKFAALRRWFRFLITETGEEKQWNFGHSQLKKTIHHQLKGQLKETHRPVATYLMSLRNDDSMRIKEMLFHLIEAEMYCEAINYFVILDEKECAWQAKSTLYDFYLSDKEIIFRLVKCIELVETSLRPLFAKRMVSFFCRIMRYVAFPDYANNRRICYAANPDYTLIAKLLYNGIDYREYDLVNKKVIADTYQELSHAVEKSELIIFSKVMLKCRLEELAADPTSEWIKNATYIAMYSVAQAYVAQGDTENAMKYFEKGANL